MVDPNKAPAPPQTEEQTSNEGWPDEPEPSSEELAAAVAFRDALAEAENGPNGSPDSRATGGGFANSPDSRPTYGGSANSEVARFALELRQVVAPRPLAPAVQQRLLDEALPRTTNILSLGRKKLAAKSTQTFRSRVVVFATVFAAAAAIALLITNLRPSPKSGAAAEFISPHSTTPLFTEPFAREGDGSARIDRIAQARSRDLRANRFQRWGVR